MVPLLAKFSNKSKVSTPSCLGYSIFLQSLAGFLSVYLGIEANYLLLHEIKVLGTEEKTQILDINEPIEKRVEKYVDALKLLSNRRREVMESYKDKMLPTIELFLTKGMSIMAPEHRFTIEKLNEFIEFSTSLDEIKGDVKQ